MKNVKMVITAIAMTLAASASVQAIELVQVENVNDNGLAVHVNTELAQSLNSVSALKLNIEKSAHDILVVQSDKQFDSIELDSTLIAAAE